MGAGGTPRPGDEEASVVQHSATSEITARSRHRRAEEDMAADAKPRGSRGSGVRRRDHEDASPDGAHRRETAELRGRARVHDDADRAQIAAQQVAAASALLASVAHDIRSPLTALVLNLRVLEEGHPSSAREILQDAQLACELIDGVLTGLQHYALCSGSPERIALRPIVESTARLFRWHMSQRGVVLRCSVERDPVAWGTACEVSHVLLNLLVNAAEASPRGGTVRLEALEVGAASVIRVTDEGPGVAPERRRAIFEAFGSSKGEGRGLGLSIARTLARRHGGELRLVPRNGPGASFELRLPKREGGTGPAGRASTR
jgi:signal transduction histidine kinase